MERNPRHAFGAAVQAVAARQRFIRAGRTNSNGCVERIRLTILEECWAPHLRTVTPAKDDRAGHDPAEYLPEYNYDRAHTGRLTQGRVSATSSTAPARLPP
jgi:hypothetical protein